MQLPEAIKKLREHEKTSMGHDMIRNTRRNIRRESWPDNLMLLLPSVSNGIIRIICTKTLRDMPYIPSLSDILADDWILVNK